MEPNKQVEVNGILFETRIAQSWIPLPPKEEGSQTFTEFEIRITNSTTSPLYFNFGDNLTPQLMALDGQIISEGYGSDWYDVHREFHFILSKLGETTSFFQSSTITYNEKEFILSIDSQQGGMWWFRPVTQGSYQLSLTYENDKTAIKVNDEESGTGKQIKNIWTGKVALPVLTFRLLYS